MRRFGRPVALLVGFALLAVAVQAAGGADEAADKEKADGFVSLFNGKNLDGWAGPTDNYEVIELDFREADIPPLVEVMLAW